MNARLVAMHLAGGLATGLMILVAKGFDLMDPELHFAGLVLGIGMIGTIGSDVLLCRSADEPYPIDHT